MTDRRNPNGIDGFKKKRLHLLDWVPAHVAHSESPLEYSKNDLVRLKLFFWSDLWRANARTLAPLRSLHRASAASIFKRISQSYFVGELNASVYASFSLSLQCEWNFHDIAFWRVKNFSCDSVSLVVYKDYDWVIEWVIDWELISLSIISWMRIIVVSIQSVKHLR